MKIVLTGATGFIGRALVDALLARGDEVRALVRDPARAPARTRAFAWDGTKSPAPTDALAGADAIVHLAGESVAGGRWTPARKQLLRDSRILSTRNLVDALRAAPNPRPATLISGSAVGFYGTDAHRTFDESAPAGADFLATLCRDWETEARAAESLGMRVVLLRTGVVLGNGGALAQMRTPFLLGAGGRVGDGRQWMPWITLDDEIGLILHALESPALRGPVNAVAPNPVTNAEFVRAFARALHRPALLPTPAFALRAMFGSEMADAMLLHGQRVEPRAALASGYRFRHDAIGAAMEAAVRRR